MAKILVVDDEPHIAKTLQIRLEDSGHKVVTADDGEKALEMVRSENPNLVILDLMLPKLNGYEVCKKVKSEDEHKNIPIIILSACGEMNDIETGLDIGADSYMTKPYESDALLGLVEALLVR